MEKLERFMAWVTAEEGVNINGVKAIYKDGKGMSIVATRRIDPGETVVSIPASALLKLHVSSLPRSSAPKSNADGQETPKQRSVHGMLAQRLTERRQRGDSQQDPWLAVMPGADVLLSALPIGWPEDVAKLLPPGAQVLLQEQQRKFERDLAHFAAQKNGQSLDKDTISQYKHAWALVNTRSFYWNYRNSASTRKRKRKPDISKLARDDCMALCPFMDFFNHSDSDTEVSFNHFGYRAISSRSYEPGEELHVTYGSYDNDLLLVEYGFTTATNPNDAVSLDHILIPRLTKSQKQQLQEFDLLGKYKLYAAQPVQAASTPSSIPTPYDRRTASALRILCLSPDKWLRYARGLDPSDGMDEQKEVDGLFMGLLDEAAAEATEARACIEKVKDFMGAAACDDRWKQIQGLIEVAKEWTQAS